MEPPRRMQALPVRVQEMPAAYRGDVWSRLVHHGDKAQRHAHLLQVEPAVDGALLKDAAHRIGQGR